MVRIGVDAVPLHKLHGGVSYYVFFLLEELLKLRPEDHFFLFTDKPGGDLQYFQKYSNVTISIHSSHSMGHSIWSQTILAAALWAKKIDVFWGTTQSVPLFKRKRMKVLLTLYDFVYLLYPQTTSTYKRVYFKLLSKWMLPLADRILPISLGSGQKLQQFYQLDFHKVVYPPLKPAMCFRENIDALLKRYGLEKGKYLVTIGTLEPRKNFLELVEVYLKALRTNAQALPLVLIGGGGWKNQKLVELLAEAKSQYPDRFILAGYATDEEIAQFLSGARYCIMVSKYEGYGMPIAEARMCRTNVICLDQVEMREAAENDAVFLSSNHWKEEIVPYLFSSSESRSVGKTNYASNRENAQIISKCMDTLLAP